MKYQQKFKLGNPTCKEEKIINEIYENLHDVIIANNCKYKMTVDFDTNKFRTIMNPTNYDSKIFNITKLDDGAYLYERKEMENNL